MNSCASRRPGGGLDLLGRGVRLAVGDVRPHAVGEEEALFEHDADLAAQRRERHVADVVPVDAHRPAAHVVKARHHVRHRRLAAAARAYEGHGLARARCEDSSPLSTGGPSP